MAKKSEDSLQGMMSALDFAGVGVLVVAPGGAVNAANDTARAFLGVVKFKTGQALANLAGDPALPDLLKTCETENAPVAGDVPGAGGRVLRASVSPLPEVGFAVVLRDATYFATLEDRRAQLSSSIGHDIKNPLTAVQGYAGLLPKFGDLNEKQVEFAGRIESSATRLMELVKDLIDLSWIEAGLEVVAEDVDLDSVVAEVAGDFAEAASERQQRLELERAGEAVMVAGNAHRLRQMVEHLVANALKFTPEKGEVTLRVAREGQHAIVAVADSGVGISDEDQKSLFERYFRAPATKEAFPGSGLGLAIVKAIAAQHGGEVSVQSEEGNGSVFTVRLPVA